MSTEKHIKGTATITIQRTFLITFIATVLVIGNVDILLADSAPGFKSDLEIKIIGVKDKPGSIVCALFSTAKGFPEEDGLTFAGTQATGLGATRSCLFKDVPKGEYAVGIRHDENGNGKLDKNFFGVPTEGWAVSKNARPSLRAPRFEEAKFRWSKDAKAISPLEMEY